MIIEARFAQDRNDCALTKSTSGHKVTKHAYLKYKISANTGEALALNDSLLCITVTKQKARTTASLL